MFMLRNETAVGEVSTGLRTTHPEVEEEEPLPGPAEPSSRFFVPEERVDGPEAWTPEQICLCNARWERYLEKVQLSALWEEGHETEQDRYRTVLETLKSEDSRLEKEGSEVSLHREKWAMMQRNRRVRASLVPHLDELQVIANAADTVLTYETRLAQMKADQEKWLDDISKNPGRLCRFKNVRIGGFDEVDSWEVRVATGLSHSRYYLGHSGGDYVFEYCGSGNTSGDEYCQEGDAWDPDGPIWNHPGLHGAFGLDQGGAETASFEFRGLVPRTWREHSARFELVCKEVLQVLATFISFEPGGDGPLWGAQYQHVPAFSEINILILTHVRDAWRMRVSVNHPYLCWARSILNHHPRICEFAYLVGQLDGRLSRGLTRLAMAPLVETVESATEMTLEELRVIYQDILGKEALRQLHESRNIEHCVLYDNEGQQREVRSQLIHPEDIGIILIRSPYPSLHR
ncbi:hypothetical protein MAC_08285 [Metarhizium acridum CQMa 102]|uniref:Uncharacterized protein n=1 Tax=Metarhizium acridum (strain CQMa 102) TaxID=655827 RepID=E9EEI7_METAQ|nr:uncharacterized protein MAC_08285 [Metarhizium acridum CQMa 102]EFY85638.1 hypothetical protein MAC_08285 [Metarhizium acridum CQMa 102]